MNFEGTLQMDKNWIFKILSYFISCFLDLPYLKKRKLRLIHLTPHIAYRPSAANYFAISSRLKRFNQVNQVKTDPCIEIYQVPSAAQFIEFFSLPQTTLKMSLNNVISDHIFILIHYSAQSSLIKLGDG